MDGIVGTITVGFLSFGFSIFVAKKISGARIACKRQR